MTEEELQKIKGYSRGIAELLYKDACEQGHPLSTLGSIEATVRTQLQEHVSPTIGAFFVKPSVEQPKDILEP